LIAHRSRRVWLAGCTPRAKPPRAGARCSSVRVVAEEELDLAAVGEAFEGGPLDRRSAEPAAPGPA